MSTKLAAEISNQNLSSELKKSGNSLLMWLGISLDSMKLAKRISQSTIQRSVNSWLAKRTRQKVQAAPRFGN